MGDKTYIGMDYINQGMKLLYSRTTGTTVAPLGPDGEMYDFYPLIEFMRKDIRDELPLYTKLFILSSVGVLMNAPNRIIKGNSGHNAGEGGVISPSTIYSKSSHIIYQRIIT